MLLLGDAVEACLIDVGRDADRAERVTGALGDEREDEEARRDQHENAVEEPADDVGDHLVNSESDLLARFLEGSPTPAGAGVGTSSFLRYLLEGWVTPSRPRRSKGCLPWSG